MPELRVDSESWGQTTAVPTLTPSRPKDGATLRGALGVLCMVEGRAGRGGITGSERGSNLPQVTQPSP